MSSSAHGAFHPQGWHIEVGSDAGSDMTAVASMHEAAHERLQHTTLWGWVTQLSFAYAEVTGEDSPRATAISMLAACRHVHEQFATFTSMITGHLRAEDLAHEYPIYAEHARRARLAVVGIDSLYHQLHAIRAVARACMQPMHLGDLVTATGVANLTMAAMDRSMRPDHRLPVLVRSLQQTGWGEVPAHLAADVPLHEFAERGDDNFAAVDGWYYDQAALLLRDAGMPTLDHDAQVPIVSALHRSLEMQSGSSLGYFRSDETSEIEVLDVVIGAQESETIALRPPLPAIVVAPDTQTEALVTGDDDLHLFVALRPSARISAQYVLDHEWLTEQAAVLRAVGAVHGQRTVLLKDVTMADPASLTAPGVPLIVSASWRSTADEAVMAKWRPVMTQGNSTILCDLPVSRHIVSWLATGTRYLQYTFAGFQTPWGLVHCLVFRTTDGGRGRSRLHLAVGSRTYMRAFDMWVEEHPEVCGRAERSDNILDEHQALMNITLNHVLAEERLFGLDAGEQAWLRRTT
jgi:hypothetical protein